MSAKIAKFLREVKVEIEKVSWPTREELIRATWVVIFTAILFGLFVWSVDLSLSRIIQSIFR